MLAVYTKNGGRICAEDVRIRVNKQTNADFHEDDYAKYSDYAKKRQDEKFYVKHEWSLFVHECDAPEKVDGAYLLRKSVGAIKPLPEMVY